MFSSFSTFQSNIINNNKKSNVFPANLQVPAVRFDAALNVTTSGSSVSSWQDITSTYNATQSTSQPTKNNSYINGKPGIVFGGSTANALIATNVSVLTNTTVLMYFVVMKIASNSGMQNFLSGDPAGDTWQQGSMHLVIVNGTFQVSVNYNGGPSNDFKPGTSVPINTPFIMLYSYSSGSGTYTSYMRLNGTSSSKNSFSTTTFNLNAQTFDIGGWSNGSARTIDGGICEVLVYKNALTQQQVIDIETYLSQKYNITVSQGAL